LRINQARHSEGVAGLVDKTVEILHRDLIFGCDDK